jgi:hypothetical protein
MLVPDECVDCHTGTTCLCSLTWSPDVREPVDSASFLNPPGLWRNGTLRAESSNWGARLSESALASITEKSPAGLEKRGELLDKRGVAARKETEHDAEWRITEQRYCQQPGMALLSESAHGNTGRLAHPSFRQFPVGAGRKAHLFTKYATEIRWIAEPDLKSHGRDRVTGVP